MIGSEILTPQERDEITLTIAFVNASYEALSDKPLGEQVEFICPVCGGKAAAVRNTYNAHIRAHCSKCGSSVME